MPNNDVSPSADVASPPRALVVQYQRGIGNKLADLAESVFALSKKNGD